MALNHHFTRGKKKTLDAVQLVSDLRTLRMKDGESASDFVMRFEAQVAKMALKDPPITVHDAILMPYLANALPDSMEKKASSAR